MLSLLLFFWSRLFNPDTAWFMTVSFWKKKKIAIELIIWHCRLKVCLMVQPPKTVSELARFCVSVAEAETFNLSTSKQCNATISMLQSYWFTAVSSANFYTFHISARTTLLFYHVDEFRKKIWVQINWKISGYLPKTRAVQTFSGKRALCCMLWVLCGIACQNFSFGLCISQFLNSFSPLFMCADGYSICILSSFLL